MTWPIAAIFLGVLVFAGFVLYLHNRSALHLDKATAEGLRAEMKTLSDSVQAAFDGHAAHMKELSDRVTHVNNRIPPRL